MANTILIKKRGTAGAPNPGDLQFGELAINYSTDGTTGQRLYYKDSSGAVQYIASAAITSSVALNNVTAAVAGTTIANGANSIVWNWQLDGSDTGFKIGETAASTGSGNTLFHVATAASSTADVFKVSNGANDLFLVDAAGKLSLTALNGTNGASVDIFAGDATSGIAGDINIRAGDAGSGGTAGDVQIVAGDGPTPGNTDFVGGDSTGAAKGGNVTFTAGASTSGATGDIVFQTVDVTGTNVNGGDITFATGDGNGTGRSGNVVFTLGTGGTDGTFTVEQGAADKLVVDSAGLVQIGGAAGSDALNVNGQVSTTGINFGADGVFKYDGAPVSNGDMLVYDSGSQKWTATAVTTGGTVTSVAATGSTGLTVGGSPITTSGTLTFTLDTGLQNLASFATTGVLVATGTDTWASRTITGTAGNIVVSNGDGVSANPTIDLATVGSAVSAQFVKITTDNYGRVTATTAVTTSDITALVDSTYVNVTGDTMTGNLTMSSGATVTGLPTPVNGSDATNKAYVDALTTGLTWKNAVRVATTAAGTLASDFENGDTVDGVTLATNDRILIKNQATSSEDGIYIVQASGAPVRATDADAFGELNGAAVFVMEGTVNADTAWVQATTLSSFLGQAWIQFAGAGVYTAGVGLDLTGNVFSVLLGAGIAELPTGEVGIDLYTPSSGAIILTTDGTSRSTAAGSALSLLLDGSTLTQGVSGLKVADSGITATQLNTSVAGAGLAGGGGTALSVNTTGVSTGIVTDNVVVRSTATAGQVLRSTGTDGAEATWGALDLANSNAVTGALAAVNGGTGQSSFAVGDLFYADSTTTIAKLPIGTTDQILRVNAGVPQWATTIDGGLF